ncbi:hypothetical protein HDU67_001844, partial [Dinochytrium kinnereticum]
MTSSTPTFHSTLLTIIANIPTLHTTSSSHTPILTQIQDATHKACNRPPKDAMDIDNPPPTPTIPLPIPLSTTNDLFGATDPLLRLSCTSSNIPSLVMGCLDRLQRGSSGLVEGRWRSLGRERRFEGVVLDVTRGCSNSMIHSGLARHLDGEYVHTTVMEFPALLVLPIRGEGFGGRVEVDEGLGLGMFGVGEEGERWRREFWGLLKGVEEVQGLVEGFVKGGKGVGEIFLEAAGVVEGMMGGEGDGRRERVAEYLRGRGERVREE